MKQLFEKFLPRTKLQQHALALLIVTILNLAVYSSVDYGNNFGIDDWASYYTIYHTGTLDYSNRPFNALILSALIPIFKADYRVLHVVLLLIKIICGFLVYLLVLQLAEGESLFALACGGAASTFITPDSYFALSIIFGSDVWLSLIFTLLALNVHIAYMRAEYINRVGRILLLVASLGLAFMTPLVREATIPILLALPCFIFVLQRRFTAARIVGLGGWLLVVCIASLHYAAPVLGLQQAYGGSVLRDFNIGRMYMASMRQFNFAFGPLTRLEVPIIYINRIPIVLTGVLMMVCYGMAQSRLSDRANETPRLKTWLRYVIWIAGGVLATWLGFAAYLPSIYAADPGHIQMLSIPGEAITLVSGIWLVSYLLKTVNQQKLVQALGLGVIAGYGALGAVISQDAIYKYASTWETTAYFMRSLAHLAPKVEEPTLFVYIENPDLQESPFVSGFSFQYAVRYFYNDTATGLVPADAIFGDWKTSEAGINMQELWIAQPHLYGWNEMIFFTRDDTGQLRILETLPKEFYNAARQGQYEPEKRIESSFISPEVRETFPLLSGASWSEHNYLLRDQP